MDELQKGQQHEVSFAPMLSVRNGVRAIEFYNAAFGAQELFRVEGEGRAVVAEIFVGESEFWLADESSEHLNFSPESLGGGTVRMVMVVDDPDATFQRAVAAGATVVWPVGDQPYGWRVGPSSIHSDTIGKSESRCPALRNSRLSLPVFVQTAVGAMFAANLSQKLLISSISPSPRLPFSSKIISGFGTVFRHKAASEGHCCPSEISCWFTADELSGRLFPRRLFAHTI